MPQGTDVAICVFQLCPGDEIEFQIREDDGNPALELVDDFQDVDVVGSSAVR